MYTEKRNLKPLSQMKLAFSHSLLKVHPMFTLPHVCGTFAFIFTIWERQQSAVVELINQFIPIHLNTFFLFPFSVFLSVINLRREIYVTVHTHSFIHTVNLTHPGTYTTHTHTQTHSSEALHPAQHWRMQQDSVHSTLSEFLMENNLLFQS